MHIFTNPTFKIETVAKCQHNLAHRLKFPRRNKLLTNFDLCINESIHG